MSDLVLHVGNKNYSSWSMRPWVALTAAGIPFREVLLRFDFPAGNPEIRAVSPSGKVPLLRDGELDVWESLAIIEYAADLFPDAGLWPEGRRERAVARAISSEMATGFAALRGACPMNLRLEPMTLAVQPAVLANVARIETLWADCLASSGGPYLFGAFCAADAMYAPVVSRFHTYGLPVSDTSRAYMQAVMAHPAVVEWVDAGRAEPWIVAEDELPAIPKP
ncbi:glutathione S-transferase family protein [Roseibium aestuarii]|uniref:Glutathione S-transferase family protein n=1 Tax=Roseibium aestuarii TaxID=2600299 RepID=A0ABW4JRF1_9HYPH|nr:glutathione S-transferase family protein [Roseibium aestuarii]